MKKHLVPLLLLTLLAGCDMLGIESPEKLAATREADGKAVGGACRHAGRAIEDCYTLNKKADKAAVYAGWREMDSYMRENKLEPVAPVIPVTPPASAASPPAHKASAAEDEDTEDADADTSHAPPAKGKKAH